MPQRFVEIALDIDQEELIQRVFDRLATNFPGWQPNEAHLEVALAEEFMRAQVETAQVASQVSAAIFREFGTELINLPVIDGNEAAALVTVSAIDDLGYTVEEGMRFGFRKAGDEVIEFEVVTETSIPFGETEVTGVPIRAVVPGVHANGIPIASPFEAIDLRSWINTITSTTESSGGVDEEDDEAYLARLRRRLKLMTPRPILPEDFSILSTDIEGVHRAVTIDGYDPVAETSDNERMVTVVPVTFEGTAVPSGTAAELKTYLESLREATFIVHVEDPSYTELAIVFEAVAFQGFDPEEVEARAVQAVTDYIDPALWAGGDALPPEWRDETVIRINELVSLIDRVEGIDYVTSVTIDAATDDVPLSGPGALPARVGEDEGDSTVTGTVT